MFSQKKSFWRKRWFVIVIIGLLGFGYWVNQSSDTLIYPDGSNQETGVNKQVNEDSEENMNENLSATDIDAAEAKNPVNTTSFYLIKEVDRVISIYYYDESGEETFIRTTDIAFSLLSEADQSLFSEGIIKNTEEELEELLQDFES